MAVSATIDGGIGQVVLDELPLNILTRAAMAALRDALEPLAADPTLRVLVLRATGKHFSAGASVEEHLPGAAEDMIPEFFATIERLERFPAPVVVAVQGRCLGGALELALAGDLIVAAESARLGVPEIALGVFPPAACVQLPARVGPQAAAELIYTGAPLDASRALALGLVGRVVPDDALEAEVLAVAAAIARHSAAALRAAKRALRVGAGTGAGAARRGERGDAEHAPSWSARMHAVQRIYLDELMQQADAVEGLRSFVEKRAPAWRNA